MKLRRLSMLGAMSGALALLAACGGGGGGDSASAPPPEAGDPLLPQRIAAATATAESNADCAAVKPFYWEIGDSAGAQGSASVASLDISAATYTSTSRMGVASASKWLYSSYYVQRTNGQLDATDLKFLRFQSGYTNFTTCLPNQSVAECAAFDNNGEYTAAFDGKFFYNGGHMQQHAALRGLGADRDGDLAAHVKQMLGADIMLDYVQPQLAGGVQTTASDYARFLRRLLGGQLRMGSMLGQDKICASPSQCRSSVIASPAPPGENWSYSLGHWVEDPDNDSDGAFSSPGLFGFYPWIDKTRHWYGIVARYDTSGARDSIYCGRQIRKAWVTGIRQ